VTLDPDAFPRLTETNHRLTSPSDVTYNCVAWSAGDTDRWWQPGFYWPVEVSREDHGIGALIDAFGSLGYQEGADDLPEEGFGNVAL